ncbi:MAG: hypothetical protein KGK03_10555 [Candidatus Omnitrophica bacterium]|nr:hypothetical protein [Candidatus Omnitrophota bacterium]
MSNQKLDNKRYLRITEIFAFVSKDKDGHEGIMGFKAPDGTWMPMIGADLERVDQLVPIANRITEVTGQKYEIRYFIQKH